MLENGEFKFLLYVVYIIMSHSSSHRGVTFRHDFANISEVRSITPKLVNCMALPAMATVTARREIIANL